VAVVPWAELLGQMASRDRSHSRLKQRLGKLLRQIVVVYPGGRGSGAADGALAAGVKGRYVSKGRSLSRRAVYSANGFAELAIMWVMTVRM